MIATLSLGFRMTLWNNGDPKLDQDLMNCFDNASRNFLAGVPIPGVLKLEDLPPDASEAQPVLPAALGSLPAALTQPLGPVPEVLPADI